MKRYHAAAAVAWFVVAGIFWTLVGCTGPVVPREAVRPSVDGESILMTVTEEVFGWVELDVSATSGVIHWGDAFDEAGYSTVERAGTFSHYYIRPAVYAIRLLSGKAAVDAVAVVVEKCRGYVELLEQEDLTITVAQYGVPDETYWVEWGDGEAAMISSRDYYTYSAEQSNLNGGAGGNERAHTYAVPGTYSVGIRSHGDVLVTCFQVTVTAPAEAL